MKNRKEARKKELSHFSFFQSIFFVTMSFVVAIVLTQSPAFHMFMNALGSFGYIGAFFSGFLFVSVFTAAPGAAMLIALNETLPALPLAFIAGCGGVIGDFVIMSVLKYEAKSGINVLSQNKGILLAIHRLRHSKYRFLLTIFGAMIIASPLPDELGVSLMGLSKVRKGWFFLITFLLDFVGVYALVTVL